MFFYIGMWDDRLPKRVAWGAWREKLVGGQEYDLLNGLREDFAMIGVNKDGMRSQRREEEGPVWKYSGGGGVVSIHIY